MFTYDIEETQNSLQDIEVLFPDGSNFLNQNRSSPYNKLCGGVHPDIEGGFRSKEKDIDVR